MSKPHAPRARQPGRIKIFFIFPPGAGLIHFLRKQRARGRKKWLCAFWSKRASTVKLNPPTFRLDIASDGWRKISITFKIQLWRSKRVMACSRQLGTDVIYAVGRSSQDARSSADVRNRIGRRSACWVRLTTSIGELHRRTGFQIELPEMLH